MRNDRTVDKNTNRNTHGSRKGHVNRKAATAVMRCPIPRWVIKRVWYAKMY